MKQFQKSLLLLALMVATAFAAVMLRPTAKVADQQALVDLETLIPKHFRDWHEEAQNFGGVINPQQKESLDKIYNQTLARTYVNSKGSRIMLSVAYGAQQNDQLRIHQPEGCYVGQGFHISGTSKATEIATGIGSLPVTRLSATLGRRHEPITYWMRIGDGIARTQWEMKRIQLSNGLMGNIPDGMLVRVSSISVKDADAFELHHDFIDALLTNVDSAGRYHLIGKGIG